MRDRESRVMRKISNNLEYITDLFESVHEKHSIEITEQNEIKWGEDLGISLFRAGESVVLCYNEISDEYEIYHQNKASNKGGTKQHYHLQFKNPQLPKVISNMITLHFDYSKQIKKKKKKLSGFDILKQEKEKELERKREKRKLKEWKNKT